MLRKMPEVTEAEFPDTENGGSEVERRREAPRVSG